MYGELIRFGGAHVFKVSFALQLRVSFQCTTQLLRAAIVQKRPDEAASVMSWLLGYL